ncbi:protein C3orf33 homolog [Clavelina lepadiformis]|uniref:protein C3orf33 homolog n=1 Tax=Clavelina lepadiformis TaxID=159417 RepID=UPI004042E54B
MLPVLYFTKIAHGFKVNERIKLIAMKFFKNVECLSIGKLLDNSSDFVDKHLRRIQNTLYGLFGISLLIVGRRLRLVKQFRLLHEIPDIYIAKQISLRGRVRDVSSSGILHVEHIPVIQLPLLHVSKKQAGDAPLPTIPVKLIGTQISESQHQEAIAVLKQLIDQNVWFKMFYREPAVSSERKEVLKCLHCLVSKQNLPFAPCINYKLLKLGLAQVKPLPADLIHSRLTSRLHKAQKSAVYWRRGIWKS